MVQLATLVKTLLCLTTSVGKSTMIVMACSIFFHITLTLAMSETASCKACYIHNYAAKLVSSPLNFKLNFYFTLYECFSA
jgi:hypothetical protein